MYEIIHELSESRLIRTQHNLKKYNAKDISDLTFLYFLTIDLLANEFKYAPKMKKYAKNTIMYGNFDTFRFNGTDLYILLHTLVGGNNENAKSKLKDGKEANDMHMDNINPNIFLIRRYLMMLRKGKISKDFSRRFLLKLQHELDITTNNYRSMRILISDWKNLPTDRKKLVMTRMLQAYRIRAPRSELRIYLERLAKDQKLEMKDVNNAETGEEGEEENSTSTVNHSNKRTLPDRPAPPRRDREKNALVAKGRCWWCGCLWWI